MSVKLGKSKETLQVLSNVRKAREDLASSYERVSSGKRIVAPQDDAAGFSIAKKQEAQVRGLRQGIRNTNDAISLAQVADGGMSTLSGQLIRLRELGLQAASDTVSDMERDMLNMEFQQMLQEIDRQSKTVEFNGVKLLDGSLENFNVQVDTQNLDSNQIKLKNKDHVNSLAALGLMGASIDNKIRSVKSIDRIDYAIEQVSGARAYWGAIQSRMQSAARHNQIKVENLDYARSQVEDADYALEVSKVVNQKLISEAAVKSLAYSTFSMKKVEKLLK